MMNDSPSTDDPLSLESVHGHQEMNFEPRQESKIEQVVSFFSH